MSDITRQAELWSVTPVDVPPIRLDDTHITYLPDGTQVVLDGVTIGLHKREPAVAVFLLVVGLLGGAVCGGVGSFGGAISGALCGGLPALACLGLALIAVVRSPKLRVAVPGQEDLAGGGRAHQGSAAGGPEPRCSDGAALRVVVAHRRHRLGRHPAPHIDRRAGIGRSEPERDRARSPRRRRRTTPTAPAVPHRDRHFVVGAVGCRGRRRRLLPFAHALPPA